MCSSTLWGKKEKRRMAHYDLARTEVPAMYHYVTRYEGEGLWKGVRTAIAVGLKVKSKAGAIHLYS